ncbi:MAG: response regulator [Patescibacteria group bacterium]
MSLGKVLAVDDEVYMLRILEFSLTAEGFEVITANNGELAIEKARQEKPDIIVLDTMMPVLNGYETCRRIKYDPETKAIPVVLLVIRGRGIDKRLGSEVGATDYIVKPFSPNRLIERIQELLDIRK